MPSEQEQSAVYRNRGPIALAVGLGILIAYVGIHAYRPVLVFYAPALTLVLCTAGECLRQNISYTTPRSSPTRMSTESGIMDGDNRASDDLSFTLKSILWILLALIIGASAPLILWMVVK